MVNASPTATGPALMGMMIAGIEAALGLSIILTIESGLLIEQ